MLTTAHESYRKAQLFTADGTPALDDKGNPIIVSKPYTQIDAWLAGPEGVGYVKLNQHGLPVGQGRGDGVVRSVSSTSTNRVPKVPTMAEILDILATYPTSTLQPAQIAYASQFVDAARALDAEDAQAGVIRASIVQAWTDVATNAATLATTPADTQARLTVQVASEYATRAQAQLDHKAAQAEKLAEYTATQEARTAQQIAEDETRAQMRELQARLRELRGQSTTRKAASA